MRKTLLNMETETDRGFFGKFLSPPAWMCNIVGVVPREELTACDN